MDETRRSLDRPILALYAPRHKSPWIGTSFRRAKRPGASGPRFRPRRRNNRASIRADAQRCGMTRQLEPLAGIDDRCAIDAQDRDILVEGIAHVEKTAVRGAGRTLRQSTHLDLIGLGDF